MYIFTYVCISDVYMYVCMYMYVQCKSDVCMYVCMYVYLMCVLRVCMYVLMYVCISDICEDRIG